MVKINKNIIYYITEDLEEKTGFFLNIKTGQMLKIDSIGVDYFYQILNAKNKKDVKDLLEFFEGTDIFE